jgi:hypothetical protein
LEQPSGGSEAGKYALWFNSYVSGAQGAEYMASLSRTSVPVSVVIDEADTAHTNSCNAAVADGFTAFGFLVHATTSGISANPRVAGNTTLNF